MIKYETLFTQNCGVSTCGDGVAEVAGHFIEVDLQDNLLSNWDEVATLCSHIPGLKSLQLHGNKIKNVPPDWPDSPNFPRYFGDCRVHVIDNLGAQELLRPPHYAGS